MWIWQLAYSDRITWLARKTQNMAKKAQFPPVFLILQREYIVRLRVLHNNHGQEGVAAATRVRLKSEQIQLVRIH